MILHAQDFQKQCIKSLQYFAFRSNNFSELTVSHLNVFLCFCMLILMLLQATHALLPCMSFYDRFRVYINCRAQGYFI